MRLQISKSKNAASLYVIKTVYSNGKEHTQIVEKLGPVSELSKKLDGQDPIEWAKKYVGEHNRKGKEENREIIVKHAPSRIIAKDEQRSFNRGYLVLQQIYHG